MPHDIQQMMYVGKEPWHGLGTPLPANGSYEEIVHVAGFYTAVERPLHSPPMEGPIPDKKALFLGLKSGVYGRGARRVSTESLGATRSHSPSQ